MKTKRTLLTESTKIFKQLSIAGFLSLVIALITLMFTFPDGTRFNDKSINVYYSASVFMWLGFGGVFLYVIFVSRHIYLMISAKPDVRITGENAWGQSAEIKIENNEPVNLSDVYVKLTRFRWSSSHWNDVDSLTKMTSNNYFSNGLLEVNRTISRAPVFVKVAKGIISNKTTKLLLDKHSGYMPLHSVDEFTSSAEYEFVFEITGRFDDDEKSVILGKYRGILVHKQIRSHGKVAEQDFFVWIYFNETNEKKEASLKAEREKALGFSLNA
jgi:hypothetical protein